MKKVRLLSLLLALLMLCGSAVMLTSCGKTTKGEVDVAKKVIDVDMTGYMLVYGDSQSGSKYTATFTSQLKLLASNLNARTGQKFNPNAMSATKSTAADKEILIGLTEREESKKAAAKIKGNGFIIQVTDNKIVIVGSDNLCTLMGVTYFTENYLSGEKNATISVNETVRCDGLNMLTVADSTTNNKDGMKNFFSYVYQDGLGKRPGAYATVSDSKTYNEFPLEAINQIQKKMADVTGVKQALFGDMKQSDATVAEKEVLVGLTSREESVAALNSIGVNEFVICATSQKIVVNAWSEATLSMATSAYKDILDEGTKKSDKTVIEIPENFRLVGRTDADWVMDFTKPEGEGISLYNTQSADNGALQFLYTGAGVTKDAYNAYCNKLKSEGYTIYGSTNAKLDREVEGSIFRTFVNKAKGTMLYVAYNAYTHKDEYDGYDWTIIKKIDEKAVGEVYNYDPCIRIVSAKLDKANLPEEKLLSQQPYTKVTESKITTMPIYSKAVGLSYIVTLEDGSFIVFDGGGVNEGSLERDILWNTLVALFKEFNNGAEPTSSNRIHIAAWVLTHAHWDHYTAFMQMGQKYASKIKMDYMIANTPAADSCYLWNETSTAVSPETVKSLQNKMGGFTYITARTGQKFYLANVEIEILTTWEELNPITPTNDNNTNTVMRFNISSTGGTKPVSVMWTGDANRWQSRFLCATYGDYLKSDMVNIAHHGNAGCEVEFYDKVSPTVVWWPNNAINAQNYISENKNKGYMYEVDHHIYNDIASVKYVFTSGGKKNQNSITTLEDGPYTTLVLTKDGPDYDNIYDVVKRAAGQDDKLVYTNYEVGRIEACIKK